MPVTPPFTFEDYVARLCGCCPPPTCLPPATHVWEKAPFIRHCGWAALATYDAPDPEDEDETVGFDWAQVPAVPIPLYLHREDYVETQYSASFQGEWKKNKTPGATTPPNSLDETLSRTREIAFTERISCPQEYGKTPWAWDASNIPRDRCSGSGVSAPAAVTGITASVTDSVPEYDDDGNLVRTLYTVAVNWSDNRPEFPAGTKVGTFALIVNGGGVLTTDEDHAEFSTYTPGCTLIQVQHIHSSLGFGGVSNGTISAPTPFYIRTEDEDEDGPCAVPEWDVCSSSGGPCNSSDPTSTHETWSQTGTYGGTAANGSGTECDPYPTNPPSGAGFGWGSFSQGDLVSSSSGNVSQSKFEAQRDYQWTYSGSFSPSATVYTWQPVTDDRSADTTIREGHELSGLITATPATMYDEAVLELEEITEPTDLGTGLLPKTELEIDNFVTPRFPSTTGQRSLRYRQQTFRWIVPEDHGGTYFTVVWDSYLVPDAWIQWRNDYYAWAVAKYAYLNRPEPGDPDYPVIGDFFDDPETDEDEREAALADAIAALPQDPGTAPEEPDDVPELIDTHTWEAEDIPPFDPDGANTGRRSGEYSLAFSEFKEGWSIQLANVRFKCYRDPNGSPFQRLTEFLTFPPPDLDPAAFDPARYSEWWTGGA